MTTNTVWNSDGQKVEQQCLMCPTCGHPVAPVKPIRRCCLCGLQIKKHHKWFINNDCKVQHKNCDCPDVGKVV